MKRNDPDVFGRGMGSSEGLDFDGICPAWEQGGGSSDFDINRCIDAMDSDFLDYEGPSEL